MFSTVAFPLRLSIILLVFIFVRADLQDFRRIKSKHSDILKQIKQSRHKRSAVSTSRPHITVHHYHYYYYCCPDVAARVRDDPRLARAVHNASCGCDESSCYCRVPSSQQQQQQQHRHEQEQQHYTQQQHPQQQYHHTQQQQHTQQQHQYYQQQHHHPQQQQQQQQHHPQQQQHCPHQQKQQQEQSNTKANTQQSSRQPHQQDPFHIDRMFNNPIGKDFFDFVTNNFVKRDSERELGECLTSAFDDPICKDFFKFFVQNFMKKPGVHTAMPENVSTHAPPQTTQQVNTQQAKTQQPQKFKDLKDFQQMDSMFNELEDNMKKAFSKTADLEKMLGIKLDDFR